MRFTPKIFICEISEKIKHDGDCCWLQGYITGVNLNKNGSLKYAVIDDGTLNTRIYINSCIEETDEKKDESPNKEISIEVYHKLVGELLCEGRYVSTICELRGGILKVLHISDSINENPNSEVEWLNSILKSRQDQL